MALRIKLSGQDVRQFQSQVTARRELAETPATPRPEAPASAALGCPGLKLKVAEIIQLPQAQAYRLINADGGPLPAFAPGQSISLLMERGATRLNRPFSLCGTVDQARRGSYFITLARREAALMEMLQDRYNVGGVLPATAPWGDFAYQPTRDGRRVLALAEGDGVLSFISLARSLAEQESDIRLTLLCCGRREQDLLYSSELSQLAEACPRVQVKRMLTDEKKAGCMPGPLNFNQLRSLLAEEPSSILVSGSRAFCRHLEGLLEQVLMNEERQLPPLQRQVLPPTPQPWLLEDYPTELRDHIFRLTLRQWGSTRVIDARAWETVLAALERAGIAAPARCRGGECGFCRAKLLAGQVYLPPDCGEPRQADSERGYIHLCCSYPLSDLELEINGDPVLAGPDEVEGHF